MSTEEETIGEQIAAKARIEAFLSDPAVQDAFARAEKNAYDAFVESKTRDARDGAWAEAKALRALRSGLQVKIDNGTHAQHERDRSARSSERAQRPRR